MMLIVRLATRNLFRQAKRNALSMVSIIFGVFIIIIGSGFALGLNENAIRAQIDSVSGHVLVLPEEYPTSGFRHPVSNAFTVDQDTQKWLVENTKAWTSRIVATPRAIKGYESARVRLMGMGDNDEQVFPREMWNIERTSAKEKSNLGCHQTSTGLGSNSGMFSPRVSHRRWRHERHAL